MGRHDGGHVLALHQGLEVLVLKIVQKFDGLGLRRLGVGGQIVASPVAANGHIYVVNSRGIFAVVRAADILEVASVNKLRERVRSTPAIVGDTLYVRSHKHLWAFAEE